MNIDTEARNATLRAIGNETLRAIQAGELVTTRNPAPYEVTEANKQSIGGAFCGIANVNPQHDPAQRTFEKTDRFYPSANYANAVHALATRIADRWLRRARMPADHLRADFITEGASAIGLTIAIRVSRFPRLASDLLARFACDALPVSTRRSLHRSALRAIDRRMHRMGGDGSRFVDPSFFNAFTDEPDQSAELNAVFVNARIDAIADRVRARMGESGNVAKAARVHLALLESAREFFLATIAGERSVAVPSAGLIRETRVVGVSRGFEYKTKESGAIKTHATETTEQTGKLALTPNALRCRIDRLRAFVGGSFE